MTLKMKLTALIASFTLVIGLMLMGVFAVNQATVNMGGSINFTATDVYARVTGKIENAQGEYANKELKPLEFSAENGTPDQSEWSGLNLLFDDDATPIVITVKVENLAKDRKLTASLTDNTAINENLVKDLKQDGVTYTSGTTKDLDASTGDDTSTTTYVVTFSIADRNKSLPQMDFELDISLYDESETPEEPEYEILEGFIFDDNGTLTSYTGTDTEVVIPSSYSIIEGESYTRTRDFTYDEFWDFIDNNMAFCATTQDFTFIIDGITYGPYENVEDMLMDEDVCKAIGLGFEKLTVSYPISGDKYIKGNDYQVTSIGAAFSYNTNIAKVTLPLNLTRIGTGAFGGCTGLTEVDFSNCTSLTSIGDGAFGDCSRLTRIALPSSLTSIGGNAFSGCSGLTSVVIPEGVTSIGSEAFYGCSGLISISLPSSLDTIGQMVFFDCDNLQPTSTDAYGAKYLGNYENPYVVLWKGVGGIYTVQSNCKIIYDDAFGVGTSVGSSLRSITIPEGVVYIDQGAFVSCWSLETVEVDEGNKVYHDDGNCIIETDTNTLVVGCKNSDIPSYVSSIGDLAFYGRTNLTSIDLSNCTSLTSIGNQAFDGCSRLTSIDLSNCTSLTSIGSNAFRGCTNLSSITFPYPTEWYRTDSSSATSGDSIDMSNPNQNAEWLASDTYNSFYFKRNA